MTAGKKYNNPPITEALIDLKVAPRVPKTKIEDIRNFHSQIKQSFPKTKDRHMLETKFSVEKSGKTDTQHVDHGIDGMLFLSENEKEVIQYNLDGYTFNRLKPYQSWEAHFPKSIEYWEKYLELVKPQSVTRIAVRYINEIDIQENKIKIEDYLTSVPSPPKDLPQDLGHFFTKITINKKNNVKAEVTQAIQPAPNSIIKILLDVDVFLGVSLQADNLEKIKEKLDKMHDFAEEIFEKSLTQKTKELFD